MFKNIALKIWRGFCHLAISIFYRHYEVAGLENIPQDRGVLLCANHVNALVDPILVQAASTKVMRPLARSGLFNKLWLKPILSMTGAVPIYRANDEGVDTTQNQGAFSRVYELLEQGEWIMIFPEGQSHSKPQIQTLKTGAARMVLGTLERGVAEPVLLPVGLTFTRKGKFRGDVLVYFGQPVNLTVPDGTEPEVRARVITRRLTEGLREVTINTDNWEDLELIAKVERFFAMRYGKYRQRSLAQRFRTMKRIISRHRLLRKQQPELVERVVRDLQRFEKMCRSVGIKDYHLNIAYRPFLVVLYGARLLFILLIAVPLFIWTVLNAAVPFYLTGYLTQQVAKGTDQYDTAKILLGFILFTLFWGVQFYFAYQFFGLTVMLLYLLSLLIGTLVVLKLRNEIFSIKENIYVFLLFLRNRKLKKHLLSKRNNLEKELARLVKMANRLID